jgi:hypothetical protein
MRNPDDVLRELLLAEAAADPSAPAPPAPAAIASTHVASALEALYRLDERPVETTSELLEYAQAEALVSIAITLADLRNLLHRGKP